MKKLKNNKPRKGFLKVPNQVLDQLFSYDQMERQRMLVYLCILKNAFFRNGSIKLNEYRYVCHQHEWLTSCRQLSLLTGIKRTLVHKLLAELEASDHIRMTSCKRYTSIRLPESIVDQSAETPPPTPPETPRTWQGSQEKFNLPTGQPQAKTEPVAVSDLTVDDLREILSEGGES